MQHRKRRRHSVRDALFLDIPYIIDSLCRHADYRLNRLHGYEVGPAGGSLPVARPFIVLPAFTLLVLLLLFAAYGATLSALCGVFGETNVERLRYTLGGICIVAAIVLYVGAALDLRQRIIKRFAKQRVDDAWRKIVVCVVLYPLALGYILPIALFGLSLFDPTAFDSCRPSSSSAAVWQLLLFLLAVLGVAAGTRRTRTTLARIAWQVVVLGAMVAILWMLPDSATATEASQMPYRHVYAVIAVAMAATALLGNVLIRVPFASMTTAERNAFRTGLKERELFGESRRDPPLSPRRIFGGAVTGVLQKPLQFLLLPAFAIILVPTGFIWHACIAGVFASVMLLIASNLTSRWDKLSAYLRRYFLLGTPLVASGAVIVIAALRLADVQYVATILNVAPFGALFVWMIMTYVLSWWFESQVNSVLATELLQVLADGDRSDTKVVKYVPGSHFEATHTRVDLHDRYVLSHPIGQFIVVGWFRDRDTGEPTRAFNTYGFVDLLSKLVENRDPEAADEINRRVQLYFALVNVVLMLGAAGLWWHFGHGDRENTVAPVVAARQGAGDHNVDLASLLRARPGDTEPAVVVAASGGGTRAAIYTAVALQGLHNLNADKNIILLSGVSGGAVAAAYFFSHRDTLVNTVARPCGPGNPISQDPWECFLDRMEQPFIRDVLQGAGEWRIQSEAPLGVLLSESFSRRLFADGSRNVGDDRRLGLILNTTVTGHPINDSPMLVGSLVAPRRPDDVTCHDFERPVAALAGGRLVFSNLQIVEKGSSFQLASETARNLQLPFVVVLDDSVELARAAALSANFPPVFPNARVNLAGYPPDAIGCTVRSYYVTDGGATENLGLVSALLALENALTHVNAKSRLRNIQIVMVEGSAFNYDYHQDRGVGAATDQSKERLTGRLTLELLRRVEQAAHAVDPDATITVYDFSLPRVFRSRGGFGTHWMFPENVRVTNPLTATLPSAFQQVVAQYSGTERFWVTLDKHQLLALWQGLFAASGEFCSSQWKPDPAKDLTTVSNWICGRDAVGALVSAQDATVKNWETFRQTVRKSLQ